MDQRVYFDEHPDPMWIFDLETLRILEVNVAAERALGYPQAELLAMTIADLHRPQDEAALQQAVGRIRPGARRGGTWRLARKSGELLHADIRWQSLAYGERPAVLAAARDIAHLSEDVLTRSAQLAVANERLREQETNLRVAQRLLGIGIWKLAVNHGSFRWSDNVYTMYGTTPETFAHTFDAYVDLVHPDDRAAMLDNYRRFQDSGSSILEFEHRIVRSSGDVRHLRGIGELASSPDGPVLTGVVQDITEQQEAAARLVEATNLMRLAGRAAGLGGWRVDLAEDRVIWTPETAAIHEEPPGTSPTIADGIRYYAPEYRVHVEGVIRRCAEQGEPFDEVLELVTARGNRVWVRAMGEPERNANGRIVAVSGAFQDISELIAEQQRAAGLSRRLLDTLESISDAFFTLDHEWRFTFLNSQAETLLRRSRRELLGQVIWDEFREAAGTPFQTQYETAMRERRTVRFTEHYAPLATWFDVSAYPVEDGLAVYFSDATDRKRSDEVLRISEERFRLVARATNDTIWDWDFVNGTVWWNESLLTVFGYDPAGVEPGPESWTNRIHPDDRDRVLASIHAVIDGTENNWIEEYRFLHANGRPLTVRDRGFVIRRESGEAVRMIGSMLDITEQREQEERLRQSQKLEAVGQLTGGVAHDFNNLLTVILGNSELLTEQLTDRQQLRLLAEMTATAAERGAQLTNRLLAFARRQALEPKLVDLNRLISGMDPLLRRTLTEEIDIEVVQAAGLWAAEVDPGQLEVALLNLAINARDAMPDGGRLTIETANTNLDDAYAAAHEEVEPGQYVRISISDTGSGMSPGVVERAFEPFFTTKEVGKGSGLGLSMVYGFVKQSGGHAKIYSERGMGTSVKLYFPRAQRVGSTAPLPLEAAGTEGGAEHILVVEDDNLVREHLTAQLEGLGYRVTGASNGRQALEAIKRMPGIDLLFTDVVMPGGMNGRELAEAALDLRPNLRVLYTSGYSENAIVHHGRLDPGVQLLTKPYRRQELAAKVRKVLDSQS